MRRTLYKQDEKGKIREWTIEVNGNEYYTISGIVGGKQTRTKPTCVFGKNKGKVNETSDEQQTLLEAETLIRIRKEQGYSDKPENAAQGKEYFQPMLAAKWDDFKDKIQIPEFGHIFIQRKLDGCRCIISANGMFSRNGKKWLSAPHIFEKLKPIFKEYPNLILDGELYYHSDEDNFNEVISLVKKSKPTVEDLEESSKLVQYWIYDLPSSSENYSRRYKDIQELFKTYPKIFDQSFVCVEAFPIEKKEQVEEYLDKFVSENYEGAIIRLDAPYECKRSKRLLKVKRFQDEEFKIIDIEEGKGNLVGLAGRVVVDVNGQKVSAGLKFSHLEAKEIWDNRTTYLGKKATIKYFNKTVDGSLRFPKCIQIAREDYE